jgi:hypothetical protein
VPARSSSRTSTSDCMPHPSKPTLVKLGGDCSTARACLDYMSSGLYGIFDQSKQIYKQQSCQQRTCSSRYCCLLCPLAPSILCSSAGKNRPRLPHATPPSARLAAALMSSFSELSEELTADSTFAADDRSVRRPISPKHSSARRWEAAGQKTNKAHNLAWKGGKGC